MYKICKDALVFNVLGLVSDIIVGFARQALVKLRLLLWSELNFGCIGDPVDIKLGIYVVGNFFGKLLWYGRGIVAFLATNAEWMDAIVIRTGSFGTSKLAEPPTKISIL